MLLTPALALVVGLPYPQAVSCALAQTVVVAAVAVVRHWRLRQVSVPLAARFLVGSVPMAVLARLALHGLAAPLGASLRYGMHAAFAVLWLAALTAAAVRWRRRRCGRHEARSAERVRGVRARSAATIGGGGLAGLLAGLLALGGGVVTMPVLVGWLGVPVELAVGTSMCQMVFTGLAATLASVGVAELEWNVIGLLLIGSVPGALVGPGLLRHAVTWARGGRARRPTAGNCGKDTA